MTTSRSVSQRAIRNGCRLENPWTGGDESNLCPNRQNLVQSTARLMNSTPALKVRPPEVVSRASAPPGFLVWGPATRCKICFRCVTFPRGSFAGGVRKLNKSHKTRAPFEISAQSGAECDALVNDFWVLCVIVLNGTEAENLGLTLFRSFGLYPRERGKYPSQATHIYAHPMRVKKASDTLKRHYQTFYLARRDPERWEHERNTSLSESSHEAWERASTAEREAEAIKKSLRHSQQQVGIPIVRADEVPAHKT